MRKIIHIDMDAFFASIEQRDNLDYRNKPLAVGYPGKRGVVAAASYEAREYGVRSAMPSSIAQRLCPRLIFTPSRFDAYHAVSDDIMEIFLSYTDLVEPLSLDEAFLDVTANYKNMRSATQIAQCIKKDIFDKTSLTASAGVSYNKFLAKIASDYQKPNGMHVVSPKDADLFVENLKIEQFYGVGKVTAKRMHQLGIYTGLDLKQKSELELATIFGKQGLVFYQNARAIDNRPVNPERIRKSVGTETTFITDLDSYEELYIKLDELVLDLVERIEEANFKGRTLNLKLKYADFETITRSRTLINPIIDYGNIYNYAKVMLNKVDISPSVRLLGVSVSNSIEENIWLDAIQLSFDFMDENEI